MCQFESFTELQPGSQADWLQVILTSLGMIAIVWTLRSQIKLTKIENARFMRENRPHLHVEKEHIRVDFDTMISVNKLKIIPKRNDVYDLLVVAKPTTPDAVTMANPKIYQGFYVDEIHEIDFCINAASQEILRNSGEQDKLNVALHMTYHDIMGNEYYQVCLLDYQGNPSNSLPMRVSKKAFKKARKGFS